MKKILFPILFLIVIEYGLYGQTILGIDVYSKTGVIDWQQVYNEGKAFAWAKATEGVTYNDASFSTNMINGNNAGVIMGAYHFARPDNNSALDEANHFLNIAGSYIGGNYLPPALDLEDVAGKPALSTLFTSSELTSWVNTWMQRIKSQTGKTPILYTNSFYAGYLGTSLNEYPIWIAKPDNSPTTPPTNLGVWSNWTFKQYSWIGIVSGISKTVDLDVFNGDLDAFNNLIGTNSPPSNDECSNAKLINPGITYSNETLSGATKSQPPNTCGSTSSTQIVDVWYKFVATATTHTITATPSQGLDIVIDLRSGSCDGINLACADVGGGKGKPEILTYSNFSIGSTYYIRIYQDGSKTSDGFSINVSGSSNLLPDLKITDGTQSANPTTVTAGSNITAYCSEDNVGDASASENYVTLWLSSDDKLDETSDIPLGQISFPSLAKLSNSVILNSTVNIPSNTNPGNYYLFFIADGDKTVTESDENNNIASTPITVESQSCTYSLSQPNQNFSYIGGNTSFKITTDPNTDCNWRVITGSTSGCALVNITSPDQGTGTSTVTYSVGQNNLNSSQSCILTISGNDGYTQDYTITQEANPTCNPTPNPKSVNFDSNGGSGSFNIEAGSGCSWNIYNSCGSMLTNITPISGNGPATVSYNVLPNNSPSSRSCDITIQQNLQSYKIVQEGICSSPVSPTSVTASNLTICNGNSTILQYTGGSGTTFNWYEGNCGGSPIGSGNDLSVSPTSTTTYYGRWESSCGNSDCKTVTITVNALPVAPTSVTASNISICSGNSTTLQYTGGSGTTFNWYEGNCGGTSIGTGNDLSISPTSTTTYYGRWESNCGNSDCRSVTITVNALPVEPSSVTASNISICNGSSTTLQYAGGSGTTFQWFEGNCGDTPIGTGNDLSVSPTSTTTYYGRWESNCGNSDCRSVTITVNALPAAPISVTASDTGFCSGNSTMLQYTGGSGTTFHWYEGTCGGTSIGTGNNLSVSPTSTTTYYGRWESSCGNSDCKTVTITVNALPVAPTKVTASNISICSGNSTTLQYTGGSGTTFNWYEGNCGGTSIGTGNNLSVSPISTTTYYGRWESSCGNSDCGQVRINVNPLPADAGTIDGPTKVCMGQNSILYTVPEIANATSYIWSIPYGTTGTSSSDSIMVNYDTSALSGNIIVKGNNSCGDGTISTLPVTVNNLPVTPVVTLNDNILLSDAITGNQWYDQNGLINGATNQYYIPSSNGAYYVIVTWQGCSSDPSNTINYQITGIQQVATNKIINIYPNPMKNELIIEIKDNSSVIGFSIINSMGQEIYKGNVIEKTIIQTSNFSPGIYLIKFENKDTSEFHKILKK